MAKMHFTKQVIENIVPTEKNQSFTDDQVRGLTLIVTPKGVKTFYLTRKFNGKVERNKLGRFPETSLAIARERAAKLHLRYDAGINVAETQRRAREELTLDAFFSIYFRDHSMLHNKRPNDAKYHYNRYLAPKFGQKKLSQISRSQVMEHHLELGRAGHERAANKAASQLRAIYNKALAWEYFEGMNPAQHIQRYRERSRDRFMSAAELGRFHRGLSHESDLIRDFFLLLLYTGARKSEMLSMRWADIDLDAGLWRIPDTKNGDPRRVVLATVALQILHRRRNQPVVCAWVFPSPADLNKHLVDVKRAWLRILTRAGIEDLRIHDLRRTHGSWMLANGADPLVIGKALGHKDLASTLVYARMDVSQVRKHVEDTVEKLSLGSATRR